MWEMMRALVASGLGAARGAVEFDIFVVVVVVVLVRWGVGSIRGEVRFVACRLVKCSASDWADGISFGQLRLITSTII